MKLIEKHHGIILLAKKSTTDDEIRYLLVKKRYTYPFILLLLGKYEYNYKYKYCIDIRINEITEYELFMLKTYKLKDIYMLYLGYPSNAEFFNFLTRKFKNYKKKFRQRYKKSIYEYFNNIVKYNTTRWVAPGGICNRNENLYSCISRELYEETGINMISDVELYKKIDPKMTINKYKNKSKHNIIDYNYYYRGIYNGKKKSNSHISYDTDYMYWYTIDEIKFIQINDYIKNFIKIWHQELTTVIYF